MVRLVFRPYTQIRRTICTSVSLRASTRVSPGFTLFRHRSPSFGSQRICSYSNLSQANDRSIVHKVPTYYFHYASGFDTQILAHSLDSLVRVSRRVNDNHFISVANTATGEHNQYLQFSAQSFALQQSEAGREVEPQSGLSFPLSQPS